MNFLKIASGWNMCALMEQVHAQQHLFKRPAPDGVGSTHKDAGLILLRYPHIPEDIQTNPEAVKDLSNNLLATKLPAWDNFSALYPYIYRLMELVEGTHLGGVAIVQLPPGGKIAAHHDTGLMTDYYNRYHIVINGPKGCWFHCGEEKVEHLTGEAWWFNCKELHAVTNDSTVTRVSVSIDISSL